MGVLNHLSTLLLLSLLPPALSHVVEKFSDVPQCKEFFLEGTTPNLTGILVGGTVRDQNRYKPICQLYNTIYRFATLYDTTNRIPVFSANTFTGKVDNKAVTHQAADTDYLNNGKGLDRGHLFPCSYAPDAAAKKSTFTLTNAVPQASSFNRGSWRNMECRVRKSLLENCKDNNNKINAYVVTGAVPSKSNTLNNRVNIPDLMWTAYCCYNNNLKQWVAQAHRGENVPETKGKTLNPETLGELEDKLNEIYHGVELFPKKCPRKPIQIVKEMETKGDNERKRGREGRGEGSRAEKRSREGRGDELKECKEEDCDCECDEK
uniref:Uncharacterized protein n=1 Tax=Hucho hucho TaxID=62062 RepID=A0A4W5LAM4_9TELE